MSAGPQNWFIGALDIVAEVLASAAVCLQSSCLVPSVQGCSSENQDAEAAKPEDIACRAASSIEYLCNFPELDSRAGEILRHDSFRTAALQLLAVLVRVDHLLPPVQGSPATARSPQQQQLPDEVRAGEHAQAPQGAGLGPQGVMYCQRWLLLLLAGLLRAVSTPVWDSNIGKSTTGTAAGVERSSSGGAGPAADASSLPRLLLLGLEFGCTLLRMHTLQCCSRQVAAVCAWMGGNDQEQEQEQQLQGAAQALAQGGQQDCVGLQGQECTQQADVNQTLDTVNAAVGLVSGLMSLAHAAVRVLQGDGSPSGGCATVAASAQHAACRRLSRRFVLLLASNFRDSRLLEHCARTALVAAMWQRRSGPSSGACGEAVAKVQEQGVIGQEAGGGQGSRPEGLLGLLQRLVQAIGGVESLLPSCEHGPAPASTVVGPAVRQALTGPSVVHLAEVLGLRAMCTADGGPDYGMPVSYSALPAHYERGQAGRQKLYSREQHILMMASILDNLPPPADLVQARGEVKERLVLLLRACDVAVASAVQCSGGRRGQDEARMQAGEGPAGRSGAGGRVEDGLTHMLAEEALLQVCFHALWAGNKLLKSCWERLQMAGPRRPSGMGLTQAGTAVPGAGSSGLGAVAAPFRPGHVTGAAAAEATEAAAAAAPAAATTRVAAAAAAGPAAGGYQRPAVEQRAGRGKALSLAVLRARQVGWWRRVCATVTHVLPVAWRQPTHNEAVETSQEIALATWLGLATMKLPDPTDGPLPPAPPPRLSAALDGGLMPCLEGLIRRAATDPADNCTVFFLDQVLKHSCSSNHGGHCFLPLLAYGDTGESMGLLSALGSLLHLPECGGGGGGKDDDDDDDGWERPGLVLERCAATAATKLLLTVAPAPNMHAYLGLGNSSSFSGGPTPAAGSATGPSHAALPPQPPQPPGLPRLHYMLAHAARLLLPPLSRFACRYASSDHPTGLEVGLGAVRSSRAAAASQGQSLAELLQQQAAVGANSIFRLVTVLLVLQMKHGSGKGCGSSGSGGGSSSDSDGSGTSSSNGGGGGSGSGSGSDSSSSGDGGGSGGSGNAVIGRETKAQALPLARFLFGEASVTELLVAVPRLVPRLLETALPGLAAALSSSHTEALCCIAAAFPDQVREMVIGPAGGSGGGGGGAGGAAAVWRTGPLRRAVSEARRRDREELAEAAEALVGLIEAWRDCRGLPLARGGGKWKEGAGAEGEGVAAAACELAALREAVGRLRLDVEYVPDSMARALLEVLGPRPALQA